MYVKRLAVEISNLDDTWTPGIITDFFLDVNESGELISNIARIDSRARARPTTTIDMI